MRNAKNVIWGSFLILIGVLLLLERLGTVRLPEGTLWPIVLLALAANSAAERRPATAAMFLVLSLVFLSVTLGWLGLTYHTAWPLLMVAAGLAIVFNALTGSRRSRRLEVNHE